MQTQQNNQYQDQYAANNDNSEQVNSQTPLTQIYKEMDNVTWAFYGKVLMKAAAEMRWTDHLIKDFTSTIYQNINHVARFDKVTLTKALAGFGVRKPLLQLRLDLFVQLLVNHKSYDSYYRLFERKTNALLAEDIYTIAQLLVAPLTTDIREHIAKISWKEEADVNETETAMDSASRDNPQLDSSPNRSAHQAQSTASAAAPPPLHTSQAPTPTAPSVEQHQGTGTAHLELSALHTTRAPHDNLVNAQLTQIILKLNDKMDIILNENKQLTGKMDIILKENKQLTTTVNELKLIVSNLQHTSTDKQKTVSFSAPFNNAFNFLTNNPQGSLENPFTIPSTPTNNKNSSKRPNSESLTNSSSKRTTYANVTRGPRRQEALKQYNSFEPSGPNLDLDGKNDSNWKLVESRKKKPSPDKYIKSLGTGNSESLTAAPRTQRVFLGNLSSTCSISEVAEYLKSNQSFKFRNKSGEIETLASLDAKNLSEVKLSHERWKGFCFDIAFHLRSVVEIKDNWPKGTRVDFSYIPRKPAASLTSGPKNSHTNNSRSDSEIISQQSSQ